jgi:hypothetical protein
MRGLAYAVTHGDDSLGEAKYPLPQTPTSLSLKINRISSKWVVWVFPSIAPTIKIRIP